MLFFDLVIMSRYANGNYNPPSNQQGGAFRVNSIGKCPIAPISNNSPPINSMIYNKSTNSADVLTVRVPQDFPTIDNALSTLKDWDKNGPSQGYVILLAPGEYDVCQNVHLDVNKLVIAGQWTPTMSNAYIQNGGTGQPILPTFSSQYNFNEGGLGPWQVETCRNVLTVTGSASGSVNPNFESLCPGDKVMFYHNDDTLTTHQVVDTKKNQIWLDSEIKNTTNKTPVEMGEGFWVSPRTTVNFNGEQKLLVQERLELRGLKINTPPDPQGAAVLVMGADAGYTQLSHCWNNGRMHIETGDMDTNEPNIHNFLSIGNGVKGTNYLSGFIGSGSHLAAVSGGMLAHSYSTWSGNNAGVQLTGSEGNMPLCDFLNCTNGIAAGTSRVHYQGSKFRNNTRALQLQSSQSISRRNPVAAVESPFFENCRIAYFLDDKSKDESEGVRTNNNGTDLNLDGASFAALSDYISGTLGDKVSSMVYEQHIEGPSN